MEEVSVHYLADKMLTVFREQKKIYFCTGKWLQKIYEEIATVTIVQPDIHISEFTSKKELIPNQQQITIMV